MLCVWNPFMPINNITLNNKDKVALTKMRINNKVIYKDHSLITVVNNTFKLGLDHWDHKRETFQLYMSKLISMIYIDAHSFSDPGQHELVKYIR
jgi:hypothetical protein